MIAQNPHLGGVSGIPRLLWEGARHGLQGNPRLYRPLATLALERSLYADDPRGYHVTSVALHVLVTLVLYGLLQELGAGGTAAFLAALLFGVHPIQTEAVDVVYNRSEVLAAMAVVGALWWLVHWIDRRPARAFASAALLYLAGLLSRESAVMLPALTLLTLLLLRPPVAERGHVRLLPPLAAAALPFLLYLWLRQAALGEPGGGIGRSLADGILGTHSPEARLAQVAATVRDYWRMIVWPWPLRASYGDYVGRGVAWAVAVHAALAAAALACLRRPPR